MTFPIFLALLGVLMLVSGAVMVRDSFIKASRVIEDVCGNCAVDAEFFDQVDLFTASELDALRGQIAVDAAAAYHPTNLNRGNKK